MNLAEIPRWAKEYPNDWDWMTIEDACDEIVDCPHSTPNTIASGPYLMVRTQDIQTGVFRQESAARVSHSTYIERTARAKPRFGDLLYSREGTYFGIAAEVPRHNQVCLGQRMVLLRPNPAIIQPGYLKFWLNSPEMQQHIRGLRAGSVAERINLRAIRRLPIAVRALTQQRNLTAILGLLEDKIDLNRRMSRTLEEIAQTLFRAWFVDFEDQDDLVDSSQGAIPRGWQIRSLPEVITVNPRRKLGKGEVATYLEMKNVPTAGPRPTDWRPRKYTSGSRFINGDVLVARITPCLENGKTAYVDFLEEGEVGWGSTEFLVLRSKGHLPLEFAYFLARDPAFRAFAISQMTGSSGRQRVRKQALDHYTLAVPPEPLAKKFGELARTILAAIKVRDEQSKTLAQLRDLLLPKLISGELRIPDAEALIEETV